ncbi:hypothetical protein MKQ70_32440 [Chitinophaga sedimenti]|uniref:hypothetical protein n=1 Tax=Chitinophaga sedimenti TaxID=2033606 RepID=UPI002004D2AF|nr:hypothetical protein [Chitinophaga sedimenti]MCK7559426.1 hypothetical protein [Chitinophaga sedimenti]
MWKRKNKKPEQQRELRPALSKFLDAIKDRQQRLALRLNNKTAHWTKKQQYQFLFGLLVISGLFIITSLFVKWPKTGHTRPNKTHVVLPRKWSADPIPYNHQDSAVFVAFRKNLNHLLSTQEGRARIRADIQLRPGLLDSIYTAERAIFPQAQPYDLSPLNVNENE